MQEPNPVYYWVVFTSLDRYSEEEKNAASCYSGLCASCGRTNQGKTGFLFQWIFISCLILWQYFRDRENTNRSSMAKIRLLEILTVHYNRLSGYLITSFQRASY